MKELNRDELLTVKGGVEIEGVTQGAFGDSMDSNGYCYGQPEEPIMKKEMFTVEIE